MSLSACLLMYILIICQELISVAAKPLALPGHGSAIRSITRARCLDGGCVRSGDMVDRRQKTPTATDRSSGPSTAPSIYHVKDDLSHNSANRNISQVPHGQGALRFTLTPRTHSSVRPEIQRPQGPGRMSVTTASSLWARTSQPSPSTSPASTKRSNSSCSIKPRTMTVNITGCIPRKITVNGCLGTCSSRHRPAVTFKQEEGPTVNVLIFDAIQKCRCCRLQTVELVPVIMMCYRNTHTDDPTQDAQTDSHLDALIDSKVFLLKQITSCGCKQRC